MGLESDVTTEEMEDPRVEKDSGTGMEELPCAVMELVRTRVVKSPVVLVWLVVSIVAGELGEAVAPRVDETIPGVAVREVRGVDRDVDWEERGDEGTALGVVLEVEGPMALLATGTEEVGEDKCKVDVGGRVEECGLLVKGGDTEELREVVECGE